MIDIENNTDTLNGKDSGRQAVLFFSYVSGLIGIWYILKYLQFAAIGYALKDYSKGADWINSEMHLPVNIFLISILLIGLIGKMITVQGGNEYAAKIDLLNPKTLESGSGTKYLLYPPGFALTSITESKGFKLDIEREEIADSGVFTSSIRKIALEMELDIVWLPYYERLSAFLQNGETHEERIKILRSIISLARQTTEVISSRVGNTPGGNTEMVRSTQNVIAKAVRKKIRPFAKRLGFDIKRVIFANCDYDEATQKILNSTIEAETINDIADAMIAKGVPAAKAGELAAIYANKKGLNIDRKVYEIEANANVTEAIKEAGPAIAAMVIKMMEEADAKRKPKTP